MLHPNQFAINEAWIAFQLNDAPVVTEQDGAFDVICLMDAASCYILGNVFIPAGSTEPSDLEARRLLTDGWAHKQQYPTTLYVPQKRFSGALHAEATRHNIAVVPVAARQLAVFTRAARDGFKEHLQRGVT